MQTHNTSGQFGNYGSSQGFGSYGRQGRHFGRGGQGVYGGNFQSQQGQQFGNYGQSSQFGSYGVGFIEPLTEDYEIAEVWYVPGTGQQGQMGQQTNAQGQQQMQRGRMMQRGPHTGKGPQRSDQHIDDDVRRRLTQHGHLDASNIDVKVNNGEVTLTGSVDSRHDKRMAENVADSVSGVKDVHNNLMIEHNNQGNGESKSKK